MKKIIAFIVLSALISGFAAPVYCGTPLRKLGRGVSNILTCPCEIPNRIGKAYRESGVLGAVTRGPIEGLVMMGYRFLAGLDETAMFYRPDPEDYAPIITDPEFFFGPSVRPEPMLDASGGKERPLRDNGQAEMMGAK